MCSLSGYTGNQMHQWDTIFFETQKHRGPEFEMFVNIDDWNLGHQRLAIIDVSSKGNQPMIKGDNVILLNGEIYNYVELRDQYLRDVNLFSNSDTEVLLELLARHGVQILNKLNGMFAFVWYNKHTKNLYLVRDRYGVKPLYYTKESNRFLFSSEIKPLIKIKSKIEFNDNIFDSFINDTATDYNNETFAKNIYSLEPGHYLTINSKGINSIKWYNKKDFEFDKKIFNNYQDTVDEFERILTDAIKIRYRSDVPVSISLSGGLDSTIIYTLGKEKLNANIQPFTFSHPGKITDETALASRLVKDYDDDLIILQDTDQIDIAYLYETLKYLEFPIWTNACTAYHQLYREIKKAGFTVVIEGHGSDEQLGGYPYMIEALYREYIDNFKWTKAYKINKIYRQTIHPVLSESNVSVDRFSLFIAKQIKHVLGRVIKKRKLFGPHKNGYFQSVLEESFNYKILPIVLRAFDRLAMASSVESRHPFMDFRVVEYIRALPAWFKVNKLGSKAILRELLLKYKKDFIVNNKKKTGFASDLPEFYKNNKASILKILESNGNEFKNIDKKSAIKIIQNDKVTWDNINLIWKALSLEMILKIYSTEYHV